MVLFHAMINMSTDPDYSIRYDPDVTSIIRAAIVAAIVIRWDTQTLDRFRKAYHLPVHSF